MSDKKAIYKTKEARAESGGEFPAELVCVRECVTPSVGKGTWAPGDKVTDEETIKRFRSRYREKFGATATQDPLYQALSGGRRMAGMEHWLPLIEERLALRG